MGAGPLPASRASANCVRSISESRPVTHNAYRAAHRLRKRVPEDGPRPAPDGAFTPGARWWTAPRATGLRGLCQDVSAWDFAGVEDRIVRERLFARARRFRNPVSVASKVMRLRATWSHSRRTFGRECGKAGARSRAMDAAARWKLARIKSERGATPREIAADMGLHVSTIYGYLATPEPGFVRMTESLDTLRSLRRIVWRRRVQAAARRRHLEELHRAAGLDFFSAGDSRERGPINPHHQLRVRSVRSLFSGTGVAFGYQDRPRSPQSSDDDH